MYEPLTDDPNAEEGEFGNGLHYLTTAPDRYLDDQQLELKKELPIYAHLKLQGATKRKP